MSQKKKIFYGYFMVVCCLVMLVVSTGIANNCAGQFITPVCEENGLQRSSMTLYLSFQNIALMILVPFLGTIYKKIKPRLVLVCGACMMVVAFGSMSLWTQPWQFWICGFIIGAGLMTVSISSVSMIMNNWFIKNKGLVMGIATAGSGLGSMIFNPLGQHLIATYGYHQAYVMLAVIMLIVFIPVFIVYRFKPEDKGLFPLGYEHQDGAAGPDAEVIRTGNSYKEAIHSYKFYILAFIVLCLAGCMNGTFTHLQAYFTDNSLGGEFAASIISITSAFLMIGKVIWGKFRDAFGPRLTFIVGLTCLIVGYLVLLAIPSMPMLSYVFAVVFGLAFGTLSVFSPLLTIALFGEKEFNSIYGSVQLFFYLGPIICNPLSGVIFDTTGTYIYAWIGYCVMIAITLIAGSIILRGTGGRAARKQ